MADKNKKLQKFVKFPTYRYRILRKLHRIDDRNYKKSIKDLEHLITVADKKVDKQIIQVRDSRLECYVNKTFCVNKTEGKIIIHDKVYTFDQIEDAQMNLLKGTRTVTEDHRSRNKHVSVGGGLLGAMVGGKTGAIVGGSVLGKSSMSGTVERHSFPVCCHLGVEVTINGLIHEIVLCNHEIDLDSQKYYKVYESANTLIEMIRDLAKTPVPTDFVKETEDPSVLALKDESEKLKKQLEDLKENRPEFVLPDTFRLEEQKDLSVDDYLDYLKEQDKKRLTENKVVKAVKPKIKAEKAKKETNTSESSQEKTIDRVAKIIWIVVMSILTVFTLLCFLSAIIEWKSVPGTIIFAISMLITFPPTWLIIRKYLIKIPYWVLPLVFFVLFVVGALVSN